MDGFLSASARIGRLCLRPERPEDDEFLLGLYASTRAEEMSLTNWNADQKREFLRWQFDLQRKHYRLHYADAAFDVVLLESVPIGRMYVLRQAHDIRLMDISLLPEFRRRGIGGRLVQDLLGEAARTHTPVTLHVEPYNPAVRLYERLGFTVIEERGINLFMRRQAQPRKR